MIEKTLIKLNWDDIHPWFSNVEKSAILNGKDHTQLIIPTTNDYARFDILKYCIEKWKASNALIKVNENGYITYEIAWTNDYRIEVDL